MKYWKELPDQSFLLHRCYYYSQECKSENIELAEELSPSLIIYFQSLLWHLEAFQKNVLKRPSRILPEITLFVEEYCPE